MCLEKDTHHFTFTLIKALLYLLPPMWEVQRAITHPQTHTTLYLKLHFCQTYQTLLPVVKTMSVILFSGTQWFTLTYIE